VFLISVQRIALSFRLMTLTYLTPPPIEEPCMSPVTSVVARVRARSILRATLLVTRNKNAET
jgi:hypothetical protein